MALTRAQLIAGDIVVAGPLSADNFVPVSSDVPANGLYLPAANEVGIATNSNGRLFIDADGNIGANAAASSVTNFYLGGDLTGGTNTYGLRAIQEVQADSTGTTRPISTSISTADNNGTGYTISQIRHFEAIQGTFHADSTVTAQTGFRVNASLADAAQNYGFISDIAAAAGKTNFNFYALGDAPNYFAGNVGIGTSSSLANLHVAGTTDGATQDTIILSNEGTSANTETRLLFRTRTGSVNTDAYISCIGSAANASSLVFVNERSSNAYQEAMRIDPSGRLLVGTNISIDTQNYLGNSYGGPSIQQHGTVQRTAALAVYNWGNSAASPAALVLNKSLGNAVGTRGALTNTNQDIGAITFTGDDGTTFLPAVVILAETDGTPGTDQMPGRIVFMTNNGDSEANPEARMTIKADGKVGIGTTTPDTTLVVEEASPTDGILLKLNNDVNASGSEAGLRIRHNDTDQLECNVLTERAGANAGLDFKVELSNPTGTVEERFRITEGGNVGINSSSPAGKLSVKVGDDDGNVNSWNANYFLVTSGDATTSHALGLGVNAASNYSFISSLAPANAWKTLKYKAIDHVFDGANDAERARIDSSGRLLVGTNSSTVAFRAIFQGNSAGNDPGVICIAFDSSTPADDAILGALDFSDSSHVRATRIAGRRDGGTWISGSSGSQPSKLEFYTTADGNDAPDPRMTINASGAVGIGVVPEQQEAGYTNIQFGGLGNLGASTAQSAGGVIYLYNNVYRATAGQWNYLVTDEATRYMSLDGQHRFDVAPSGTADTEVSFAEKVRIDTDGLKFNGDTAAANALDDYEEGTWTASLFDASFGGNQSSTTITGRYTKIGSVVNFRFGFSNLDTTGLLGTGAAYFNLPFAAASSWNAPVAMVLLRNVNWAGSQTSVNSFLGNDSARFRVFVQGDDLGYAAILVNELDDGVTDIFFSGTYTTA